MYLTYDEYVGYGGNLDSSTFGNFAFQAESIIDYITFNRLSDESDIPEKVKRLMVYIIDIAHKKEESLNLGQSADVGTSYIKSQSNDGVSVTYNGMQSVDVFESCEKEILQAIKQYLTGVKNSKNQLLLYRGLYRGE